MYPPVGSRLSALGSRLAALALAFAPAVAWGQTAVLDEGTLQVSRNGAPLGRESFRIVRAPAPGGQVYRATAQNALGDVRTTSALGTDSAGAPMAYTAEVFERGRKVQRLEGKGRAGRLSMLTFLEKGESARE